MQYILKEFGSDDTTQIDETEVIKAIHAQSSGQVVILGGSAISGKAIQSIKPDINEIMGWNKGYKPTSSDYAGITSEDRGEIEKHRLFLEEAVLRVSGRLPGVVIPLSKFSKELGDQKRIT